MVVEEEEESSGVGSSGKASLSVKVVLVLLAVEAGAVKESSGFLPSRRVLGRALTARAIKAGAVKASWGSCHQGRCRFLKQFKGESASLLVQILFMAVVAGRAVPGARGSGSVGASCAGRV